ncbi:hypothetical protein D3C81_1955280 [compost metagenome]
MAGVDRHLERLRVVLEQGFLAVGKLAFVLRHVLCRDGEQRFLIGVGIRVLAAAAGVVQVGRCTAPFPAPGGDAAFGIAGFFRTHGGEFAAQAGGLFRA